MILNEKVEGEEDEGMIVILFTDCIMHRDEITVLCQRLAKDSHANTPDNTITITPPL